MQKSYFIYLIVLTVFYALFIINAKATLTNTEKGFTVAALILTAIALSICL